MNRLLAYFLDLCLLRAAPQDLSASGVMLGLTLVAHLAVTLLLVLSTEVEGGTALGQVLLDVGLTLIALYGALLLVGRLPRFLQAATALLGSSALIGLVTLPLIGLATGPEEGPARLVGTWLLLLVIGWSLLVSGSILRHTFELRLAQGVLIAAVFNLFSYALVNAAFPVA